MAAATGATDVIFGELTVGSVNVKATVIFEGASYEEIQANGEALESKLATPSEVFTGEGLGTVEVVRSPAYEMMEHRHARRCHVLLFGAVERRLDYGNHHICMHAG